MNRGASIAIEQIDLRLHLIRQTWTRIRTLQLEFLIQFLFSPLYRIRGTLYTCYLIRKRFY